MSHTFPDPTDPATIERIRTAVQDMPSSQLLMRRRALETAINEPTNDFQRANKAMFLLRLRCINDRIATLDDQTICSGN